ncbi:MAG: hypothetical protein ABSF80_05440 [Chitinispirillaceae bacterium]|jgi:hypothetical protein
MKVVMGAGFAWSPVSGAVNIPNIDGLYFFYQRTIYLENLCQPAAWWANPSLLSPIDKVTVFTSNAGLIGRQYTISSVRVALPINQKMDIGFGVTGTGTTEGSSLSAGNGGAQYSSNFNFNLPSLEAGASYTPPVGGNIGALFITGTESVPDPSNSGLNTVYFFWGFGAGWLSPSVMNTVKFSISTISVYHSQFITWWDNCAKTGILINAKDGGLIGSLEYGFSLFNGPVSFFQNKSNFHGYETIKGCISLKMMGIAGILLGYSNDSPPANAIDNNGATYHAGIELRRSTIYPYYGGYEFGISTAHSISIIHRIWIGYSFIKKS